MGEVGAIWKAASGPKAPGVKESTLGASPDYTPSTEALTQGGVGRGTSPQGLYAGLQVSGRPMTLSELMASGRA